MRSLRSVAHNSFWQKALTLTAEGRDFSGHVIQNSLSFSVAYALVGNNRAEFRIKKSSEET